MSDVKVDIGPIVEQAIEAAVGNLKDFFSGLNDNERVDADKCVRALSEQMIRLALTNDDDERFRINATIAHLRNALSSIRGAAQYRAYNVVLKTVTDVVAAIGAGLLKALI